MTVRLSYCGAAPLPDQLWSSWNLDPILIAVLAVAAGLFWQHRRTLPTDRIWGLIGFGVLLLAFVSPLCALTNALFSARTVHHLLLIVMAAPLFAMALANGRQSDRSPMPALLCSTALLWFWHWPPAYSAALTDSVIYWLMQVSLLGAAIWFWCRVLRSSDKPVAALLAILAAMTQMGLLGAILTFAPAPLYAEHLATTAAYGLSAHEDQQLAGLIMWVPAMLPYLALGGLVARSAWRRDVSPA